MYISRSVMKNGRHSCSGDSHKHSETLLNNRLKQRNEEEHCTDRLSFEAVRVRSSILRCRASCTILRDTLLRSRSACSGRFLSVAALQKESLWWNANARQPGFLNTLFFLRNVFHKYKRGPKLPRRKQQKGIKEMRDLDLGTYRDEKYNFFFRFSLKS